MPAHLFGPRDAYRVFAGGGALIENLPSTLEKILRGFVDSLDALSRRPATPR